MSEVDILHNNALDLAEEAFHAKQNGELENARNLFLDALSYESKAAEIFPPQRESEPTRSILFRSAAALAFHAGDFSYAEQLVARGLSGFPPEEIKEELRALQDDIAFYHHISLKGVELTDNEMQMTLWGEATGYGKIAAELLVKRVEQIKNIFYRTIERLAKLPYRITGNPDKSIIDSYKLYLNGFMPGSFRVSFLVGQPEKQLELFPDYLPQQIDPSRLIDEVLTCFELLQEDELDTLRGRFNNDNYFQNFIGIAKQMAPDGESIKLLGFASYQKGVERTVQITKTRPEIPTAERLLRGIHKEVAESQKKPIQMIGVLKMADSLKIEDGFGVVRLHLPKADKTQIIRVPISQMQDVVQPFFEERVKITGRWDGRRFYLEDIESTDEEDEILDRDTQHNIPPTIPGLLD